MDSSGRLRFGAHTSWQTEEQKAALASYMVEGMLYIIIIIRILKTTFLTSLVMLHFWTNF